MSNFVMPRMASVSDLQRNYASLIKKVKRSSEPLLVLKKNKPEVIILNNNVFNKMLEKAMAYEELQALEAVNLYEAEKRQGKLKKARSPAELFIK